MRAPRPERDPRRGPTPIGRTEIAPGVLIAQAAGVGLVEATALARAATSVMAAGGSP